MKTGSHNSLSYGRTQWWFRPLAWTARCQSKDWRTQLNSGVRYFDLRVRYVKGRWVGAHGLATYEDVCVEDVLSGLNMLAGIRGLEVYVSVMLENSFYSVSDEIEQKFVRWYEKSELRFGKLNMCGAFRKRPVYELLSDRRNHMEVPVFQLIYHMNPESFDGRVFGIRVGKWVRYVKSLVVWPRYWAARRRRLSEELLRRRDDERYLFMDFV